ncbi:hypothetical protein GQ457_07G010930 [Hibiscus cannabinus]
MSILELDDMVKELGYTTPHNMYWKQPWGMLKITPLKTEFDMLSMLGCLPRNKYVHVYIEENVRQKDAPKNNSEPAWIDEDETIWGDECVRNYGNASDDEELEYIASDNQDSNFDSLLEDSDNDLVDGDDEVCNVVVAVSRDILGFSAGTRNGNQENESETKSNALDSLHSASDSETYCKKVNDSKRLQVICKEGCPWMIWASRLNPKDELDKTCRAKKLALQMIHGNEDEQYEIIYDYLGELRGTNPGTTTICHLDNRLFVRMYVCLQACKDGFKAGCRPIINIDGCFLKGHYQGYLLAAIGIDANDCIYPLAYATVESENRSSWCWFLRNLEADLELTNSYHYTFMSDKQKGLIEEIADFFPNVEHRTCVRHVYTNFKSNSGFQGKALKDALWKAARTTYMKEYTDAMKEIRYEVSAGPADQHVIDLGAHTCSCRRWDLTGIPCIHVVAAILMRQERPETYVANCYSKHIQTMIYSHHVRPLRGPNQWAHLHTNVPILPPVIRRPVGRPQKNRRKEADEILTATERMSKRGVVQMTCRKCGNIGHNRRSCKGPVGGNTHLPSNVNARVPKRKTTKVATSSVPQSTSTANVSTAHVPPAHRISKLDVRRSVSFNAGGSSKQNQLGSQHPQGSI